MIPITNNNLTYFFSIVHVTKLLPDKLIYGVLINSESYYLSKTIGIEDCTQIDSRPPLDHALLLEICDIMTRFEVAYQQYPSLEFINVEIIKALEQIRNAVLPLPAK
jgi:hypothetical protein